MSVSAQRKIDGQISDRSTGEALVGATVLLKGSNSGTTTNIDGIFSIAVPSESSVLVVSYTGFETQEITVGFSEINIQMVPSSTLVEEVVVIGYGKQIKSTLTGNIAKIGGENLKSMPVVSVEQAMQGQAAGVFVEKCER